MLITHLDKGEFVRIYLKSGQIIEGKTADAPGEAEGLDTIEIMSGIGITFVRANQIAAYTLVGFGPPEPVELETPTGP